MWFAEVQVPHTAEQHRVMIEAVVGGCLGAEEPVIGTLPRPEHELPVIVSCHTCHSLQENHMPEVLVIDEIGAHAGYFCVP